MAGHRSIDPRPDKPGRLGGRPPRHSRRDIVDAIRYVAHNGRVWRALPADFPPVEDRIRLPRPLDRRRHRQPAAQPLREQVRHAIGREIKPIAATNRLTSIPGTTIALRWSARPYRRTSWSRTLDLWCRSTGPHRTSAGPRSRDRPPSPVTTIPDGGTVPARRHPEQVRRRLGPRYVRQARTVRELMSIPRPRPDRAQESPSR